LPAAESLNITQGCSQFAKEKQPSHRRHFMSLRMQRIIGIHTLIPTGIAMRQAEQFRCDLEAQNALIIVPSERKKTGSNRSISQYR